MMECRRCREQKEESAFKKRSSSKTGYVSTCKSCAAEYSKRYYEEHRTERLVYAQGHRRAHPVRVSQAKKAAYNKNKPHYRELNQLWKEANPERKIEIDRLWRLNNPERRYEAEKRRRLKISKHRLDPKLVEQKIDYWGRKCWMCKTSPYQSLDHVKPLNKGGAHMLCNIRPACLKCNSSKSDKWPIEFWACGVSQEEPN